MNSTLPITQSVYFLTGVASNRLFACASSCFVFARTVKKEPPPRGGAHPQPTAKMPFPVLRLGAGSDEVIERTLKFGLWREPPKTAPSIL
jgi:hypothetical protein